MAADKLTTFNLALTAHLGQTPLASLVEDVEAQRVLSALWDGVIAYAAQQAYWRFAMDSQKLTGSATSRAFGPAYVFTLPAACVKLFQVSLDGTFDEPFNGYMLEGTKLYSDVSTLYVRFVSSTLITDLTTWPQSFTFYIATRLARLACTRLTQSGDMLKGLQDAEKKAEAVAESVDAMQVEVRRLPLNSWVRSRAGYARNAELGNTSSLIG